MFDSHSTGGQHKVVSMLFSSGESGYARCCAKNETQKLSRQRARCQLRNLGSLWIHCPDPAFELGQTVSKAYAQLCVSAPTQILNYLDNILATWKDLKSQEQA